MSPDWLRLSVGTLTAVPVPPPRAVDSTVARRAMLAAPLVGAALAVPLLVLLAVGAAIGAPAALAAVLAIALLAALSRGLHLDGLADTADALGSGRSGADGLAIMSRSDIGPFGVVTLVLALLAQCAALAGLLSAGGSAPWLAAAAVAGAAASSRAALPLACRTGVRAAKASGVGAVVASTVPPAAAVIAAALACVFSGALGWFAGGFAGAVVCAGGAVVSLIAAQALVRRCVRRFGGISGDVLGAAVETAFTVCVITMAIGGTAA